MTQSDEPKLIQNAGSKGEGIILHSAVSNASELPELGRRGGKENAHASNLVVLQRP